MPGDASSSGPAEPIAVGGYTLDVNDPEGSRLAPAETPTSSRALRRALRRRDIPFEKRDGPVESASQVTSKIEEATTRFEEFTSGGLDVATLNDEADALLALLGRLSGAERWQDVVRVARRLSAILSLLERWIELLRSLRTALRAAKEADDTLGEAWALHELGTLRLIAGRHAEADRDLGQAREIRKQRRDNNGLSATNNNLEVLCQTLRRLLHQGRAERVLHQFARRPALAVVLVVTLVVVGGAGGAVLARSHNPAPFYPATVTFSFAPRNPHAGQSIVFSATVHDARDPAASYTWRWGDGDPAPRKVQRHEYRAAGRYEVVLTVRDTAGRVIGRHAQSVLIERPVHGPSANFSYQPHSPATGSAVSFDASPSYDPHAAIVDYEWSFGDGAGARGARVSHSFTQPLAYNVSLTVTDAEGKRNKLARMIVVGEKRQPTITVRCPTGSSPLGREVTVLGSISPPRPGATVRVVYRSPAGTETTLTSTSGTEGAYTASFTPEEAGTWSVDSSQAGNGEYRAGESKPCTFAVAKSEEPTTATVSCPSRASTTEEAVTVSGSVTPPRSGVIVNVVFRSPAGREHPLTSTSDARGSYTTSFTPDEAGTWTVQSSPAESGEHHSCRFSVGPG